MILYINGDSHSAAAEAVNSFAFAKDDPKYTALKRQPHPDNLAISYGAYLAKCLNYQLYCAAESASSNDRIIRTTKDYLTTNTPDLIVIGWSTWEREEWFHDDVYWQINAGGIGEDWPPVIKEKYKKWIARVDYTEKLYQTHEKIWAFHKELGSIPHLFFNTYTFFNGINQLNWDNCYIEPYNKEYTFYHWLNNQGFNTVNQTSYHYGVSAHRAWAKFLLTHITKESKITT